MQTKNGFTLLRPDEFTSWLNSQKITRKITKIQLHHTASPSYKNFTGTNHFELQSGMKNYHVNSRGFSDIAQHFTIFPDGRVCTGRSLNTNPAGITGGNDGAICIENLGYFDKGQDEMTEEQYEAIIIVTKALVDKFSINSSTNVVYHAWYTANGSYLGDYIAGKSTKTCPGTNFFGGNTRAAFERELLPYLKGEKSLMTEEKVREIVNEILSGNNTSPSDWAMKTGEWTEAKNQNITDGTRPQGYAKREEVAAMILRTMKNMK